MSRLLLLAALGAGGALAAPDASPRTPGRDALVGAVVASDDYVLRRGPRRVEQLSGNVRYLRRDKAFRSDWALVDHDAGLWRARGSVRASFLLDTGEVLFASGHDALHDLNTGLGQLTGKDGGAVSFLLFEPLPGGPALKAGSERAELEAAGRVREGGEANKLSWDEKLSRARLEGRVRLRGREGESWAEQADYERAGRTLVLAGHRPVLRRDDARWSGAVQADRIRASEDYGRVEADGKAAGWMRFQDARGARR